MANRASDKKYRTWRAAVIRRDSRCIICNSIKRRSAHHLNNWSYHPDERYDVSNGITLCGNCHIKYHTAYKYSFREKTTKKNFDNFVQLLDYLSTININTDIQQKYDNIKVKD